MPTKNISLPQELARYVDKKVATGEYAHASEVVREAVRLMMLDEVDKLELLREAIADGVASEERGELIPDSRVVQEIRKRAQRRLKARRGAA